MLANGGPGAPVSSEIQLFVLAPVSLLTGCDRLNEAEKLHHSAGRRFPIFGLLRGDFQQAKMGIIKSLREPCFQNRAPKLLHLCRIFDNGCPAVDRDIGAIGWF